MIPLRDTIPSRRFPIVNIILIVVNVIVFLGETLMSATGLEQFIMQYGLTPALFWQGGGLGRLVPIFTSMFLHGGWWHLISNMLALYIFGDNIEDRTGHLGYLAFYIFGGVAAAAAQLIVSSRSLAPMVGASGAIAAVLGAYLVLYPRARVVTLVPIFYFMRVVQIPAPLYLGFWFVSQLFNGFLALGAMDAVQAGGVAWFAHIGGFAYGLVAAGLIALGSRRGRGTSYSRGEDQSGQAPDDGDRQYRSW
jgi:membrane associated rhomboid family serine protease